MTSLANYSKWDRIELSDDEDNFHPNIDNNLMIRLQREKRQQREAEEEEKRKKLEADNSEAAKEELARMERTKKLHVGNISTDKFVSKHEKSAASESANPMERKDEKLKVAATNEATFTDGYEAFLEQNRPLLMEYAAIDEEDEKSEQFILANTQLLSEHATGFCARPRLEPRPPPSSRRLRLRQGWQPLPPLRAAAKLPSSGSITSSRSRSARWSSRAPVRCGSTGFASRAFLA